MRYIDRSALVDKSVPKDAIILDETPHQISYAHDGKIVVFRIFEVPGACEGCLPQFWGHVALVLVVADVLKAIDYKPTLKLKKKTSTKKKKAAKKTKAKKSGEP